MARPAASIRSRFWLYAALLAALFVAVRVIFFRQLADSPLFRFPILDSEYYHHWAMRLAWGKGHPPGPFWLSPFYAVFMAGLFKVFGSISVSLVVIAQFALSVGTLAMIVIYTRRLFDDTTALWTAGLAALYGPWLFYDGVMLSASLIIFLDALLLLLLITQTDRAEVRPSQTASLRGDALWLILGLITALSALSRPSVLIFALVLVAWQMLRAAPGWWRRVVFYAAAIALLLLPVMLRNWAAVGTPTLTTASGGVNFFIGNREGASGMYDELDFVKSFDPQREAEGYRAEASKRVGRKLTLAQASRFWGLQAAEDIGANPGRWLRLSIRKAWLTVQREEIATNISLRGVAGFTPVLNALPVRWGLLFPLAAAGMFAVWRRRRALKLLLLYAASYFAVNLIFFSSSEYRFPMILVLLPAAGCFFAGLWRIIRARDSQRLVGMAAVYVVALVISNFPSKEIARAVKPQAVYYNMATGAVDRDMVVDAIPLYARALAVAPDFSPARVGLAKALWRIGNHDEARQEFALAGVAAPDSISGSPMATFLDELYEYTEAENYQAALALMDSVFPTDKNAPLEVWTNRAMVEAGLKHYGRAADAMMKAQAKEPDSPEWSHKAGRLALMGGDTMRADSLFRLSLRKYAAYAPARLSLGELALSRNDSAAALAQFEELRRIRIPDDSVRQEIRKFALKLGKYYEVWTIGQQE
ncbi:MAG: tetratricopeptide repeat protein [bacterium]|nr:tetratricopeptide repeat protein [bacterium]